MFEHEAGIIRRMMRNPGVRIVYSDHAERERMVQRKITDNDVRTVLKRCRVTLVEDRGPTPVWNAEGSDLDGRRLRVCVRVNEEAIVVVVITVIDLKSKA